MDGSERYGQKQHHDLIFSLSPQNGEDSPSLPWKGDEEVGSACLGWEMPSGCSSANAEWSLSFRSPEFQEEMGLGTNLLSPT